MERKVFVETLASTSGSLNRPFHQVSALWTNPIPALQSLHTLERPVWNRRVGDSGTEGRGFTLELNHTLIHRCHFISLVFQE